ncbi:MAG: amino acid transporter [Planctomycetes bacterium RBG_13_62_9]|nr:MAG: amino acid transporter [Planctomycetes bacterium RBG_13_62_9]
MAPPERRLGRILRNLVIGKSRDPRDAAVFHRLSLVAFFAWIGLGADGLSSSNYGPAEAFLALGEHPYLSVFVGLGTVITIFVIAASYSQIVELFPTGGGGYFVATKLLSPWLGMVSGCALLIDYVLTIAVSIASGADAIFSFMPLQWHGYRLHLAVVIVVLMMLLNMRGVRESVIPLVPIFLTFLVTHVFVVLYGLFTHLSDVGTVVHLVRTDVHDTMSSVGFWGLLFLVLHAYSMGAGTYTGIEAVSNGLPVLREPKVQTARLTMRYMAFSLAFMVMGLILGYLLYDVGPTPGRTLNAVLFEKMTASWSQNFAGVFILVCLLSEATLLSVAAQTGFLGGPRVLANMSLDRWFPTRFSVLSDRLVIQNGILIMGGLALVVMLFTKGSVRLLVVLYSINVFITFFLSQVGMVRHWWRNRGRAKTWKRKLMVCGVGLVLTAFILTSMIIVKFFEGGWVTLLITGTLIVIAILVKRHYHSVGLQLRRLDELAARAEALIRESVADDAKRAKGKPVLDPNAKTAVLLVSGFNGTGLHTLLAIMRLFGGVFKNFVFLEIGVLDVGNFKGPQEVERLHTQVQNDLDRYVEFMNSEGFYAEAIADIGVDAAEQITRIVPIILQRHPGAVFFGGKLLFLNESVFDRLLHNQLVFTIQKRLHRLGIPFVILPIYV